MSAIVKTLSGSAVPIRGDEVDTDRIIPARFLKEITFERMGEFLFADARVNEAGDSLNHPLDEEHYAGARALIVGRNFGCGSSREHAPQAVKRYGIDFLVGKSFAEIFAGNCKALGMPAVTAEEEIVDALFDYVEANPSVVFTLDLEAMTLSYDDETIAVSIMDERRNAFLEGTWDALNLLSANMDKVRETATSLPHMSI